MRSPFWRTSHVRVFAALLGALATALASHAAASMALAVSLQELVERADHIVLARTVATQSLYDAHGRIVTDVEVVVEHTEKGPTRPGDSLVVRTLGGVVDGLATQVIGAPVFEVGQRQVLFAIDAPDGSVVHTLELSQGLMRVFERDGAPWVHGGADGLALRKRGAGGALETARAPSDQPLHTLLSRVRALVEGGQ